jgi:thiol-disulfide isomerase/thioredoxin
MKKAFFLCLVMLQMTLSISAQNLDSLYSKDLLKAGTEAPDFTLKTPNGPSFTLSSQRGHYIVIEFWASWCKDCRKIKPMMNKISCSYSPDSVVFVGVSFDNDKEVWTKYLTSNYKDFIIHVSELKPWKETEVSKQYGIKWIPTFYLIDPNGKVVTATTDVNKLAIALKNIDKSLITSKTQNHKDYYNLLGIVLPQYHGGTHALMKFLSANLKYPKLCEKCGAEGKVLVKFTVDVTGKLDSIHVIKTKLKDIPNLHGKVLTDEERLHYEQQSQTLFNTEALRVVNSMGNWIPGTRYGHPVKSFFTLPISFKLR